MRGGGELAHVQPELGDDHLGGLAADAGDLIETIGRGEQDRHCLGVAEAGLVLGWLGSGDGRCQLLDPGREAVYLRGQRVDVVQQHPGQFGVVVVKAAGQRLPPGQRACRASVLGRARPAPWGRVARRSGPPAWPDPKVPTMSVATVDSLIRASTRQPAPAVARAGNVLGSGRTAVGCSRATGGSRRVG